MHPRCFNFYLGVGCLLVLSPPLRADEGKEWFAFDPKPDTFAECPLDLRFLNEKYAGENGFIAVKDGHFIHSANGQPARFWAVNGPPEDLTGDELRRCAKLLARYGVNLVRVHGALFDKDGEPDLKKVQHAHEVVAARIEVVCSLQVGLVKHRDSSLELRRRAVVERQTAQRFLPDDAAVIANFRNRRREDPSDDGVLQDRSSGRGPGAIGTT